MNYKEIKETLQDLSNLTSDHEEAIDDEQVEILTEIHKCIDNLILETRY